MIPIVGVCRRQEVAEIHDHDYVWAVPLGLSTTTLHLADGTRRDFVPLMPRPRVLIIATSRVPRRRKRARR